MRNKQTKITFHANPEPGDWLVVNGVYFTFVDTEKRYGTNVDMDIPDPKDLYSAYLIPIGQTNKHTATYTYLRLSYSLEPSLQSSMYEYSAPMFRYQGDYITVTDRIFGDKSEDIMISCNNPNVECELIGRGCHRGDSSTFAKGIEDF